MIVGEIGETMREMKDFQNLQINIDRGGHGSVVVDGVDISDVLKGFVLMSGIGRETAFKYEPTNNLTNQPIPRPPCANCPHEWQYHYAQGGESGCEMRESIDGEFLPSAYRHLAYVECSCPGYEPKSYDTEPIQSPEIPPDFSFPSEAYLTLTRGEWPLELDINSTHAISTIRRKRTGRKDYQVKTWLVKITPIAEMELVKEVERLERKLPNEETS
jgi:hypothetical protein